MPLYPPEFFKLQLAFAQAIHHNHGISFEEALFRYTPIHVRLFGFSDEHPPQQDTRWKEMIASLPNTLKDQTAYIYDRYQTYERNKVGATNQIPFGCFSYSYHQESNSIELHFSNNDPEGNLGKDRIEKRTAELKKMFAAMQAKNYSGAKLYIKTWLLNVPAFTRLYPPLFIASSRIMNTDLAQDLADWGQFLDRHNILRHEAAKALQENAREYHRNVHEYFPQPNKYAEADQNVFFDFYLK